MIGLHAPPLPSGRQKRCEASKVRGHHAARHIYCASSKSAGLAWLDRGGQNLCPRCADAGSDACNRTDNGGEIGLAGCIPTLHDDELPMHFTTIAPIAPPRGGICRYESRMKLAGCTRSMFSGMATIMPIRLISLIVFI
jgi:hypothetical protein